MSVRARKKQNNPKILNKNNAGQVIIETIVALSIVVIGLLAVFALTSSSIGLNRVAADRYVAVNLANEGIELVKNLIDKNITDVANPAWNNLSGFQGNGDYEIDYDDGSLKKLDGDARFLSFGNSRYYYCDSDCEANKKLETTFSRKIIITKIETGTDEYGAKEYDHVKVVSRVDWTSRKSKFDFEVQDDFYNLKGFKKGVIHSIGL